MQEVLLGIAGIIVSIATFVIGYRKTIGARQARADATNNAVVDALLRRIVLEQVQLTADDVENVIAGKAVEAQLPVSVLRPPRAVVNVIFARILESDLISKPDRDRALYVLTDLRKDAVDGEAPGSRKRGLALLLVSLLAIFAAFIGTLAVALFQPDLLATDKRLLAVQFVAALFSITVIAGGFLAVSSVSFNASRRQREATSPTLRELNTFPDEREGRAALELCNQLSPFAVRNLANLAEDEVMSIRSGVYVGLQGDEARTLGLYELISRGCVEKFRVNSGLSGVRHRLSYRLTPQGRAIGRLLYANVEYKSRVDPPAYLVPYAAPPESSAISSSEKSDPMIERHRVEPRPDAPQIHALMPGRPDNDPDEDPVSTRTDGQDAG